MLEYQQTLEYLYAKLPVFQKSGGSAIKKGLGNTLALLESLNNPHLSFSSVHVAGTNGKGSTSHILASLCQHHGLKTGLYTSPHLVDFTERIKINGKEVGKAWIVTWVESMKKTIERIKPSFFEVTVAMAFAYFKEKKVDIAIIETGMGGRLDSTNVVNPILSIITNIGYDHMEYLGDTLAKIAAEKAGIVKTGTPVVIGEQSSETLPVFENKAKETNSDLILAEKKVVITRDQGLLKVSGAISFSFKPDLAGSYQLANYRTSLAAWATVLPTLKKGIDLELIKRAVENVQTTTQFLGRWQILQEHPLIVCDTGHNIDGIRYVVEQLKALNKSELHLVFGMVKEKDHSAIIDLLPEDAVYYLATPKIARGLPVEELYRLFVDKGLNSAKYNSIPLAIEAAEKQLEENGVLFIGGSTFVVAEIPNLKK